MYDHGLWEIEIKTPDGQTFAEYFTRKKDAVEAGKRLAAEIEGLTYRVTRPAPYDCRTGPFLPDEETLFGAAVLDILRRITA
ncbi:MAG: hypothetical protein RJA59_269 [Pseudomonadota bacterium]